MTSKKRALGRGLSALLPVKEAPAPAAETHAAASGSTNPGETFRVPVGQVSPNPYQPRAHFDDAALEELVASVREHGVIQPITVCRRGDVFTLVAGERRWRAATRAGLESIPAHVVEMTDQELLECSIVENLQREDLNAMEEARAYQALMEQFAMSPDAIAKRLGKARTTIVNALRLLKLPADMQEDVEAGRYTAGHARAILSLTDKSQQIRLRQSILDAQLSVRQAEHLANEIANRNIRPTQKVAIDPNTQRLREALIDRLACRVEVKAFSPTRGKIEIFYESLDELERVLQTIGFEQG